MASERILVIDDDEVVLLFVAHTLNGAGYETKTANNAQQGLAMAIKGGFDLIVLDLVMPEIDGFTLLKELRRSSHIPVLLLTSRSGEEDMVEGLERGADDYIQKPFSPNEFLARVRAVIRRSHLPAVGHGGDENQLIYGELRINPESRVVTLSGEAIDLSPIEYNLLLHLSGVAGKAVSRNELLDILSGREYDSFDRAVDVHISSLRKKLSDTPASPRFIETVRGFGYKFHNPG